LGYVFLFLTVLGFGVSSFFMKLGVQKKHDTFDLSFSLFFIAAIVSAVFFFLDKSSALSREVVLLGIGGGIGLAISFICFIKAINAGHYGLSVAIASASFIVQVLYSIVAWKEPVSLLGILVILTALFLLAYSSNTKEEGSNKSWLKWFVFIFLSFLTDGLALITQAEAAKLPGKNYSTYLFVSYSAGAVFLLFYVLKRRKLDLKATKYGLFSALGNFAGIFFTLKSLETITGNIVFPVYFSGYNILGVLLSVFYLKEKINIIGYIGIALGITGIIITFVK